ncbi:MAG: hypothetical protein ACFFD2_02835 [Promethearchaeota archaeon]
MNITQLIIFIILIGVSLAIMIYLLAEDSDIADMPLVPLFLTFSVFGLISAILTIIEVKLLYILIIVSLVSVGIYIVIYYGFKAIVTNPHDLANYIGKKAVVEIPIEPNSTGRVRLINTEHSEAFPAKSDKNVQKNREVFIEKFIGAIAYVIPIPGKEEGGPFLICTNCNAHVDISNNAFCPYCGNGLKNR